VTSAFLFVLQQFVAPLNDTILTLDDHEKRDKLLEVARDIGQCSNHQETRPAVRERHSQQV